jgi:hypothetical protein
MIDLTNVTEADRSALQAEMDRAEQVRLALRRLDEAADAKRRAARKQDFIENKLNRLFFKSDPSQGIIELVRPTSCDNFGEYNQCYAARLTVFTQGKTHHPYNEIRYKHNDTIRVDQLDGHRFVETTDVDLMSLKFTEVLDGYLKQIMKGL